MNVWLQREASSALQTSSCPTSDCSKKLFLSGWSLFKVDTFIFSHPFENVLVCSTWPCGGARCISNVLTYEMPAHGCR